MYYALFDDQGNRLASYRTDHPNIPDDAIEISDEDQELYATNRYIRVDGRPQLKPAYIPTMDERKLQKWTEIKSIRDTLESASLPYMGKVLDFDDKSQKRLDWASQNAQIAIIMGGEFTVDWTCADSSTLTMTAQDILGIPIAIAQRSNAVHIIARGLAQQIADATTVEDLETITWPT